MCGLAGFLLPGGFNAMAAEQLVGRMADRLTHRGPDDEGVWVDELAGIALGHRRLAILDLSQAGHQPMVSGSDRYVVAFNGEIYNHLELRRDLELSGALDPWCGHSDTETLLAAVDRWGIEAALGKLVGMFAFALWDRQRRVLTLARDRLGEKPLYYGVQGDVFLFGSELKALRAHPAFRAELERSALAVFLKYGYIPSPASIYRGIFKLPPGTYLQFTASTSFGAIPEPIPYWSLRQIVERGAAERFAGSDAEAALELERLLLRSVSLQRIADVPLGAFLSGGVDSSTVVALMQANTLQKVKTFTIGYHEAVHSEARFAEAVAKHLGTDHTTLYVTARDALDVVPRLPALYDEPFGDSSAIPSFLVSSFARRHVTVALSGDGGDELFGGYSRYQRTADIWRATRRIPYPMRSAAASAIRAWRCGTNGPSIAGRAERLSSYLAAETLEECYDAQVSHFPDARGLVIDAGSPKRKPALSHLSCPGGDLEQMMCVDSRRYLPDDVLTKVDRASMAVSLEVRVPMLDHRLFEFAWRLPSTMRVRDHEGKWLLKQLLRKFLPSEMIERPKMGFGIPVGQWLRGPLREWGEDLLTEERLRKQGYLNPQVVRRHWQRHLNADKAEGDSLWQILAFQAWAANCA